MHLTQSPALVDPTVQWAPTHASGAGLKALKRKKRRSIFESGAGVKGLKGGGGGGGTRNISESGAELKGLKGKKKEEVFFVAYLPVSCWGCLT